jgi:hypothetical protein
MKGRRFLSSVLTALVISVTLGAGSVQAAATVERAQGNNREQTANALALKSFTKADNVILVYGYDYADAVSATPLAKQLNAPILLTDKAQLDSSVLGTIKTLGASKVTIIGGKNAVSQDIENTLRNSGYGIDRIEGATRMETNANVAKRVLAASGQKGAILVNGQDVYADALSVASIAAKKGYPVLFASRTEVAPVVKEIAKGLTVWGVGGEKVLPTNVVKDIIKEKITDTPEKSADRYATNLTVLKYFASDLDFSNVYVATGGTDDTQFADALVASAAAAVNGSPVVLTGSGSQEDQYISSNGSKVNKVIIVGGETVVPKTIEDKIKSALGLQTGEEDGDLEVVDIY